MKFWYFKFEGTFTENSTNYGNGLFSGCMIPERNFQIAKKKFLLALKNEYINLIELVEQFSVDGEELDKNDKDNKFWIKYYNKTKKLNIPVFDTWHLYKLGT